MADQANSTSSEAILAKVRRFIMLRDVSPALVARQSGLPSNALDRLDDSEWAPSKDTCAALGAFLAERSTFEDLASTEEIIDEARNGRMFILVDDVDRENEGDLVIPAQMATPDAVNFMAKHGRGLICLAMTSERTSELGLDFMSENSNSRQQTAFTVSIEAREGVTTGISARDRARTISVAIDSTKAAGDIVSPGHVFPLVAREGGVLVRAGHTEAAVDVARLAGLNPSGVICEIMNDDGTMARLDNLIPFARRHNFKIGTIRDLIAYRRRNDHLVRKILEVDFDSHWGGRWKAITFFNTATQSEQLVLQKGEVDPNRPTLVRMHQLAPLPDLLGERGPREGLLARSMEMIGEEGGGVVVILNRRSSDDLSKMIRPSRGAFKAHADTDELRDYGVGAQILAELGINDMVLLTNSRHSMVALDGYGLNVICERPIKVDP